MKKAISKTRENPSPASLRELPEVDVTRYRVRRNPYAAVIAREGATLVHDEPSPSSLAEIPEIDLARARVRRSSLAGRARHAVIRLKAGRGRPKRGQEVGPTPARSIRLPTPVWDALEQAARGANTTVHALLRLAVTRLLETRSFEAPIGATRGSSRAAPRGRAGRARSRP